MSCFFVSDFYKQKFGTKVYKLTVDAGCTCPNRDGTKALGGCIFCNAVGSGDFIESRELPVAVQVENAKKRVEAKFGAAREKKYIVYFQNFTNTYGDPDLLFKKFCEAAECRNVVGIAIATRPDCVGTEILKKIASLCNKTFVSIELGLQTTRESTAAYIRRFYSNWDYTDAVDRIHKADSRIHVVTHLIFGLPGDKRTDMMNSVKFAVAAGTDGIKISCLYILKGTAIEKDFLDGKVCILGMDEYFSLIKQALTFIPDNIVIHRLTGDGPKKYLLAPEWTKDKKTVLNRMHKICFEP